MHTGNTTRNPRENTRHRKEDSTHYQASKAPPSPPMEESRCSLPSISNLLGLADAGSPGRETSPSSRQHSPPTEAYMKVESRPGSSHMKPSYRGMPPTPPMSTDASFDNYTPPSHKVNHHYSTNSSRSGYYHETTPPLEVDVPRQPLAQASQLPGQPMYSQQLPPPAYVNQPAMGTYYPVQPPQAIQSQAPGLYHQRPLPQSFPPPMTVAAPASGANPWQHHHYLNPAGGTTYPQSQDRYICPTCSKAFSRPSSLRIHSHSHTGEKPFKCPHTGCGKAFSVRSNMKRHERGCHSFEVSAGGSALTA